MRLHLQLPDKVAVLWLTGRATAVAAFNVYNDCKQFERSVIVNGQICKAKYRQWRCNFALSLQRDGCARP
eukprot:1143628-Pelagomonas_calceolata.AAC.6